MKMGLGLGVSFGRRSAAAAPDFVATSVANCRSWHVAGTGVTDDGSGKASAWADQSGAGDANRNLSQGTAVSRPTITAANANFNGRATLDFGGSQFMVSGGAWTGGTYAQPTTIYLVCRFSALTAFSYVFDSSDGTGGVRQAVFFDSTPAWNQYSGAVLTGGTPASGTTYVLAFVFNGASSAIYANKYNTTALAGDAGALALHSLTLGTNYDTSAGKMSASVAQIATYSGAHDAATRQSVMQSLGTMYGVTVTA